MTPPPEETVNIPEPQVWYTPRGQEKRRIVFGLEADLKLDVGLKPNVWTFKAFASDLLPLSPEERYGKIELRISRDDKVKPLVVFDGVEIVDTQPDQMGVLQGTPNDSDEEGPTDPNGNAVDLTDCVFEPITFKVFVADERCRFQKPRGGLLELGEFNVPPLDYIKNIDRRRRPILFNKDLLGECLKAMGYEIVDEMRKLGPRKAFIPSTVDDYPKQENVSWRGTSATEEFERLLKVIGFTVAYQSPGGLRVFREGTEPEPDLDKKLVCAVVPDASIDRRPAAIVVSSAPTGITEIQDFRGMNDYGFQYVWRDVRDSKYKLQSEIDYLKDLNLFEQYRKGWEDLPKITVAGQEVDVKQLYDETAWCRIRLNPEKFPNVSFFAKNPDPEKGYVMPTLFAKAVQPLNKKTHRYEKAKDYFKMKILNIQQEGTVIATERWLLNLDVESCADINLLDHLVVLGANDVIARMSYESFDQTKNRPAFFHIGYFGVREDFTTFTSERDIAGLDAEITIPRPECHLIRINGEDQNRPDVEAKALQAALNYLPPTKALGKKITLLGWQPLKLTPRIASIKWNRNYTTEIYVNAFGSASVAGKQWEPDKPTKAVSSARDQLDTSTKEIVFIESGGSQTSSGGDLLYAKLAVSDGSDGGISTKPSYRYSVFTQDNRLLEANVIPTMHRVYGSFIPAETGIIRIKSDGSVMLLWCDEVPNTGDCGDE